MTVSQLALLDSDVTAPIRPVPVDVTEPLPATPMLDASQPHWVHEPPPAPWLPVDPEHMALAVDEQEAEAGSTLRCGSNCGSCIPALRGLVKAVPLAPRAVAA